MYYSSSLYCSIQSSIKHQRIFTLESFWCRTQFRAKSKTWPIVINFILDLDEEFNFQRLVCHDSNRKRYYQSKNLSRTCLHQELQPFKMKFSTSLVTSVILECFSLDYSLRRTKLIHRLTLRMSVSWMLTFLEIPQLSLLSFVHWMLKWWYKTDVLRKGPCYIAWQYQHSLILK